MFSPPHPSIQHTKKLPKYQALSIMGQFWWNLEGMSLWYGWGYVKPTPTTHPADSVTQLLK